MTTHTHIGNDTLEVCLDALEIVLENDDETLKAFLGADWDLDYLHEIMAAGITDEIGEYEISEIQTYLDRFNAYTIIKETLNVEQGKGNQAPTGNGWRLNCARTPGITLGGAILDPSIQTALFNIRPTRPDPD